MTQDVQNDQLVEDQEEAVTVDVANQPTETPQELNFRELRESKERYKREAMEKDRIIAELRASKEPKQSLFKGDPDDWLTVGNAETNIQEKLSAHEKKIMKEVQAILVSQKYPNASELISKYGKEIKPQMAEVIANSGNLEAAIQAVQMTPSYIRDHSKTHINAQKATENASRPKSTLNAGSSGAVSKTSRYASMTREQRMALQDRFSRGYKE